IYDAWTIFNPRIGKSSSFYQRGAARDLTAPLPFVDRSFRLESSGISVYLSDVGVSGSILRLGCVLSDSGDLLVLAAVFCCFLGFDACTLQSSNLLGFLYFVHLLFLLVAGVYVIPVAGGFLLDHWELVLLSPPFLLGLGDERILILSVALSVDIEVAAENNIRSVFQARFGNGLEEWSPIDGGHAARSRLSSSLFYNMMTEAPFLPKERLKNHQQYFQNIHRHTYLKGRYDKLTSVAIPLALTATSLALIARGIYNMSHGVGKKA
ncbi:hypothetical protein Taro_042915, partial [Colocasia esculenta]|nr:hypothetical protein [Colocasia esculenta]